MIDQKGFSTDGQWFKGNLHSHTTESDGNYTPQEATQEFRKQGYSFLCISDHNLYTDYRSLLNTDDFIILPGLEAAAVLFDKENTCICVHHVNGILGTTAMQQAATKPLLQHKETYEPRVFYNKWDEEKVAQEIIDDLHERGCFVTYNHPMWSRVSSELLKKLYDIDILEIFNYNTENESGTGYITSCWDQILRQGRRQLANAADDNHNDGIFDDAFGGFIMVNARNLTHDAIVSAILSGNYYSSAGPYILEWGIKNGTAYICCDSVERINFIADGYVGAGTTVIAKEEPLQKAEWKLTGKEKYIRIECVDAQGRRAWTNPMYIK